MSPDFIFNFIFLVYVSGIFLAFVTILSTDTHKKLSEYDIVFKVLLLASLSWIIVVAILAPKILRLYKHKW